MREEGGGARGGWEMAAAVDRTLGNPVPSGMLDFSAARGGGKAKGKKKRERQIGRAHV